MPYDLNVILKDGEKKYKVIATNCKKKQSLLNRIDPRGTFGLKNIKEKFSCETMSVIEIEE